MTPIAKYQIAWLTIRLARITGGARPGAWAVFLLLAGATVASAQPQFDPFFQRSTRSERPDASPAQTPVEPAPAAVSTAESLRQLTSQIEASTTMEAEAREALLNDIRAATEALQRRDTIRAEGAVFTQTAADAPARIEQLRSELATPPAPVRVTAPSETTLEQIRETVQASVAQVDSARVELQRIQTEAATRATRLDEIPRLITDLRARLAELPPEPTVVNGLPDQVRALRMRIDRQIVESQIQRAEAEAASYRARQNLLPLRRDLAQRRLDQATQTLEGWRTIENNRVRAEAQAQEEQARRLQLEAARLAEPLKVIADQTSDFVAKRLGNAEENEPGVVEKLTAVRRDLTTYQSALETLVNRSLSTRSKVDAAGLSGAIGILLRNELGNLPSIDPIRRLRSRMDREIGEVQYLLIVVDERLSQVSDIEAAVPAIVADAVRVAPNIDPEIIRSTTRDLLINQREILLSLRTECNDFIDTAAQLDAQLRNYETLIRDYRLFIEERVLWTRSVPGQRIPRGGDIARAVGWLIAPESWTQLTTSVVRSLAPPSFGVIALGVGFVVSLVAARKARKRLTVLGELVRKFTSDRFSHTLWAIPLTLVMSFPVPLLLWLVAAIVGGAEGPLAGPLATAFTTLGILAIVIESVRHSVRPMGLADIHFRWARDGLADFRFWLLKLEIVGLTLAGLVVMMREQPSDIWNDALGRLIFIVAMFVLAGFYAIVMAPWRPFVANHLTKRPAGLIARSKWIWYPALVAIPLALAALALAGFYYTAIELDKRVQYTMWFITMLVLLHSVVLRWLFVERRKLLVERAKQKREEEAAKEAATADPNAPFKKSELFTEPEQVLNVPDIDAQTRRIISAALAAALVMGVYGLWSDVLPALRVLKRVQIYPVMTVMEDPSTARKAIAPLVDFDDTDADTAPAEAARSTTTPPIPGMSMMTQRSDSEELGIVTLDELILAFIVVALTWVLATNLPGLLEITVLKRLPLDAGARFAISAVLRYILGIIGILIAFGVLGIGWSQVQWLVAALTFGLAFGLQEIFANFISGLIILAERPIRVGDVVTVQGVSGKVTQIRIRSTTIRDWTLKEVILPNKVFITDQVINWTLTDYKIRVEIQVGVSYSADIDLVEQTLLELGRSEGHVLVDPAPRALFLGFGDSTLNFELRVCLDHFDYFMIAKTNLNKRILKRFRELGIEIAFPQRDLNIRAIGPLAEAMASRKDEPPAKPPMESA